MRQVLIGDLIAVARVALMVPPAQRGPMIDRVFYRACVADKQMKRLGRPHRLWGNGSLLGAVAGLPKASEPFLSDPDYLDALARVVGHLRQKYVMHSHTNNHDLGLDERAVCLYGDNGRSNEVPPWP